MAPGSLESTVLNSTNYYRSQHLADPVQWNDTLADFAKDWAEGCIWKHSGGPYGENLAANFENSTLGIDAWGNEEKKYNYGKGKFTEENGHFTQLVWRNTTDVGCAVVDCENDSDNGVKGAYLVCEYSPRGNVEGQFKANVRKPGISEDGKLGFGSAAAPSRSAHGLTVFALVVILGCLLPLI
ncbi:Putative CAP domain-containing protein [Septoria linicola]|uniref:CAP domain-containing protein n=1 Tax=Septoria linicola TaxID=215465 RepID=A0A9Q9B4C3_9PEZI|nr:Putative CAP domain-containing protein [Septoria linicola]